MEPRLAFPTRSSPRSGAGGVRVLPGQLLTRTAKQPQCAYGLDNAREHLDDHPEARTVAVTDRRIAHPSRQEPSQEDESRTDYRATEPPRVRTAGPTEVFGIDAPERNIPRYNPVATIKSAPRNP